MDPFEEAQKVERELIEATRRLDEEERRIQEESRRVGENMRLALVSSRRAAPRRPDDAEKT